MEQYDVQLTPYALRQMTEIVQYISTSLQAPSTAEMWLDRMEEEISSLSVMPARFPLTAEAPWHSQGIHKMLVNHFFIYFWIDTETLHVWVTAVVYAKRSQKQQLELMELPEKETNQ